MKLIIRDDNNQDHVVIEKVEREFSSRHVGEVVLQKVNTIEIENGSGVYYIR